MRSTNEEIHDFRRYFTGLLTTVVFSAISENTSWRKSSPHKACNAGSVRKGNLIPWRILSPYGNPVQYQIANTTREKGICRR
jgi:hypothetical protein